VTWNPALAPYKNAIINELFIASSLAMYIYFPGDGNTDPYPSPSYSDATNTTLPVLTPLQAHDPLLLLDNAVKGYQWIKTHNFTNSQGLYVEGFHISDNQTTYDQRDEMVSAYIQGIVLSGLHQIWELTGDVFCLADGCDLIETVINATGSYASNAGDSADWHDLGRDGIMEDRCDAPPNCSQDARILRKHFHHFDLFCEPLPTHTPLVAGLTNIADKGLAGQHTEKCKGYTPWVEHNVYAALSTRDNSIHVSGGW